MIRLITINRLSLLRETRSGNSAVESAAAQLSTTAVAFDSHLLQRPTVDRPLDALGTAEQQERLRTAVGSRPVNVCVVTADESDSPQFPEWMTVSTRMTADCRTVTELLSPAAVDSAGSVVEWFHVQAPSGEPEAGWAAACLEAAAASPSAGQPQTLIVTAIAGEPADPGRFETLLWEGQIRLPLWIRSLAAVCGRVVRPTGSFDVLETILSCLGAADSLVSPDQPIDLRLLCDGSFDRPPRSIRMSGEQYEAVRTADSLFVRTHADPSAERTALYGKPHDVWNVHDLSHEFPHVVDDLMRLLPPVCNAADSSAF